MNFQEMDTFARLLRNEILKRGPLPERTIVKESLKYLAKKKNKRLLYLKKVRDCLEFTKRNKGYGIRTIRLFEAVQGYFDSYKYIKIKRNQLSLEELIYYTSKQRISEYVRSAYVAGYKKGNNVYVFNFSKHLKQDYAAPQFVRDKNLEFILKKNLED